MSVTTKGCLLCTWGISLQHFSVQRDYLLVTHISKLLRMFTGLDSKLFVYKLDLTFYYKSPYWRVIWGVYIMSFVLHILYEADKRIFSLWEFLSLLILTASIDVIVCKWRVYARKLMLSSLNTAKLRILYYK